MTPKIVRNVVSLRRETARWKTEGLTYAIVPTMGALHEGHLDLVREGFKRADRVVVSIFVNPKQFGAKEDLSRYPRDEESDVEKLNAEGVPLIFRTDIRCYLSHWFFNKRSHGWPCKSRS